MWKYVIGHHVKKCSDLLWFVTFDSMLRFYQWYICKELSVSLITDLICRKWKSVCQSFFFIFVYKYSWSDQSIYTCLLVVNLFGDIWHLISIIHNFPVWVKNIFHISQHFMESCSDGCLLFSKSLESTIIINKSRNDPRTRLEYILNTHSVSECPYVDCHEGLVPSGLLCVSPWPVFYCYQ